MIPPELQPFDTYCVSVSGGKDSTALMLWALEHLPPDRTHFVHADTGAQWPENKPHLAYLQQKLGVTIHTVRNKPQPWRRKKVPYAEQDNLYDTVKARGYWPGARFRYCTKYLKQWPLRAFASQFDNPIGLTGQRRAESSARAKLPYFTARDKHHIIPLYRPILDWTDAQVWTHILKDHGLEPNPVYQYANRVSCWCCIMGRRAEVEAFCRIHPEEVPRWIALEREIGHKYRPHVSLEEIFRAVQLQPELIPRKDRLS